MKKPRIDINSFFRIALGLATVALAVQFARQTYYHGNDFDVFWTASRYLLDSQSIYTPGEDPSRVFKYPPWCIWFFVPFGFFSLGVAKAIWGVTQALSLFSLWIWLRRVRVRAGIIALTTVLFLGLLNVHAFDGQISLFMIAILAWTVGVLENNTFKRVSVRGLLALSIATSKIFSFFPLFIFPLRVLFSRTVLLLVGCLGLLTIPILLRDPADSLKGFLQSWFAAMWSGGKTLGWEGVRGKYNQGLGALLLRKLEIPETETQWDLGVALVLALCLGVAWKVLSRHLSFSRQFAGWCALAPVIHPLPYWYSFVFAFPLCAILIEDCMKLRSRNRRNGLLALALLGTACISMATEKTLGSFGLSLLYLSIKSFGVLLCCLVLVWATGSKNIGARP